MPLQQGESNFSFGNLTGEVTNFTENYMANANNYWENQPIVPNHINMIADEERYKDNNENNRSDAFNKTVVSGQVSTEASPLSFGVPSDFHGFLP